jgi:hypothetical protein
MYELAAHCAFVLDGFSDRRIVFLGGDGDSDVFVWKYRVNEASFVFWQLSGCGVFLLLSRKCIIRTGH